MEALQLSQQKLDQLELFKQKYQERLIRDPTFRQKMNERSLARYYKLKEQRQEVKPRGRPKKEKPVQPTIKNKGGRPRKYFKETQN
jgi:hypothetical protein